MEQLKKMNNDEGGLPGERFRSQSGRRGSQKLGVLLQRREHDSDEERELPHEPKPLHLNPKSSLAGLQISDADEKLFFSRRSAMSSMIAENFRSSSRGSAVSSKWEAERGKPVEQLKSMQVAPLMLPPSGRDHQSGGMQAQPTNWDDGHHHPSVADAMAQINAGSSRLPSGLLYPCSNPEGNPNSCLLNAAHFTFDSTILAPDLAGAGGSSNNLTERIFKKLMGQSRSHRAKSRTGSPAGDESKSPNSTLDCPTSPASSERSFRGKPSTQKSLRRRSEDANTVLAANPRPKSQLAQYLRSMTAMSGDIAIDDDDFEGPSEAAWLDPDSPYHPNRQEVDRYASAVSTPAKSKKKLTLERWSSNSSSWNLSLVQNPLKTVSTIVSRRHRDHGHTPGRGAVRKSSRFGKDAATHISLTGSYDGSTSKSQAVRKGNASELGSGRSWWSEIGSGRKSSSMWACSGRLQTEAAAEAAAEHDLHEPRISVQSNNVKSRAVQPQVHALTILQPGKHRRLWQLHNKLVSLSRIAPGNHCRHDSSRLVRLSIMSAMIPWSNY